MKCHVAAAQSPRPEVPAHRLAEGESIVLDGVPDEAAAMPTAGTPASRKIRGAAACRFYEYQAAHNAAVGFTRRRNYRHWNPEASWQPRLDDHPIIRGLKF